MQKHKENLFLEKFSLLNSQEHNEDIKWSSSSSSDYENTSCNCNDKLVIGNKTRKRKRKCKKKVHKNISNLDITIIDASKDHMKHVNRQKSPILVTKRVQNPTSPILISSRFPPKELKSPILYQKSLHQKSPILMLKSESPKNSFKVRKKLAYNEQQYREENNTNCCKIKKTNSENDHETLAENSQNLLYLKKEIKSDDTSLEIDRTHNKSVLSNSIRTLDGSEFSQNAKLNLIKRVKNYFDSHFSSENTSQNISDTPSPEESIKTEAIDILSCRTQTIITSLQPLKHDNTSNSDNSNDFEKNKKVKYKKGGLAYRLNMLLKKRNAHVSLWQHERFLAETSNFVIPKGDNVVFCIRKIDFSYGCYLLEAVDVKNEKYVIFINSLYVNNNISTESVFKLYEPYRIVELDKEYKIIVNVCKFECYNLNK